MRRGILAFIALISFAGIITGQTVLKGTVVDGATGDVLIGTSIVIQGTTEGTISDWDGSFEIKTEKSLPLTLEFSFLGYGTKTLEVTDNKSILMNLEEDAVTIESIEVSSTRITDKQRESPLTVESMDIIAIKETPAANFYDGLGSLKDVDLTTASLGFTIVNTRGFNSTNPVRSLQLIDGVDNQSPGLNFSLGNFLGASDLDVNKVELIVGASTAFYGPNAFNGVINMETKDPFFHKGLSVMGKIGERSMYQTALRWADSKKNKDGFDVFAYKFNAFYMNANDWEADNFDPVFDTDTDETNPGGYDAVNVYGDEYRPDNDFSEVLTRPGLGIVHRKGYSELDLVEYDSYNVKASGSLHFRLKPEQEYNSPEFIMGSSFGGGTTVYQGENRFSLRDIKFYQHRLEIRKKNKYFFRVYATHEDAGRSFDPFFTALKMQEAAIPDDEWSQQYFSNWSLNINPRLQALEGYPRPLDFIGNPEGFKAAADAFLEDYQDSLLIFHQLVQDQTNSESFLSGAKDFYEPGTERFQMLFDSITTRIANSEGGTRFFDKSALIHAQGEYRFTDVYQGNSTTLDLVLGGSARQYLPNSQGSILLDTMGANIDTYEYGFYGGGTFGFNQNRMKINFSARVDQHENFSTNFSPAASFVYTPSKNNFLRMSFSSAIRNPTLTDQYLNYNVGRAILRGNISGVDSLVTIESFIDQLNSGITDTLEYFNVAPIRTEKVKTFEIGYRSTLFNRLWVDMGYYFSSYTDFIGFQFGIDANFVGALLTDAQAFRVSSNSLETVTTQGFSIGLNYYFWENYMLKGNYSWNKLNTDVDDPIIPAFNTPEHKFNIGLSARNLIINLGDSSLRNLGFSVNYKWIEGFIFEGSPQFTGFIPSYGLLDAQVNWTWQKAHTTFKLGASNILNNEVFQTYGGPRVGRLAYFSITYDWIKK